MGCSELADQISFPSISSYQTGRGRNCPSDHVRLFQKQHITESEIWLTESHSEKREGVQRLPISPILNMRKTWDAIPLWAENASISSKIAATLLPGFQAWVMIAEAIAQDADMPCMSNDHYVLHMAHAQYARQPHSTTPRQLRDSFVVVPVV